MMDRPAGEELTVIEKQQGPIIHETTLLYFITILALPSFFVFDAANKILITYSFSFYRASIFIRTFFELVFIFITLAYFNRKRREVLMIIFMLWITFATGQILLTSHVDYPYSPLESVITFNKYLFVFVVYAAIYKLKDDQRKLWKCITALEYIFITNSIAVFIGLLTGWDFLKTYIRADYRYGYMGLIPAPNEATLFYLLAVSLAYYKRFILQKKSISFIIILSGALLIGTKGIYVFLILLLIFHLVFRAKRKIWLLALAAFAAARFVHFAQSYDGRVFLAYFYNEASRREWLSMLLSGRDILLRTDFSAQIAYWTVPNYLFGGQDVSRFITEMDFFDCFLFFGLFGSLLYLLLFFITLFRFHHTPFTVFFVASYLALAFAGGHFFNSALNGLYLCLVCLLLSNTKRSWAT